MITYNSSPRNDEYQVVEFVKEDSLSEENTEEEFVPDYSHAPDVSSLNEQ